MVARVIPLLIFVALVAFLAKGLTLNPQELPSPLIDKPAPVFELPALLDADLPFQSEQMSGRVWVLNVWASWCRPCIDEHPLITRLARESGVPVLGLNYKDDPVAASNWLTRFGNPFSEVVADREGRVGIDWGVYGVPETFVIDAAGRVRYKHVGPIDQEDLERQFLPLLNQLQSG